MGSELIDFGRGRYLIPRHHGLAPAKSLPAALSPARANRPVAVDDHVPSLGGEPPHPTDQLVVADDADAHTGPQSDDDSEENDEKVEPRLAASVTN